MRASTTRTSTPRTSSPSSTSASATSGTTPAISGSARACPRSERFLSCSLNINWPDAARLDPGAVDPGPRRDPRDSGRDLRRDDHRHAGDQLAVARRGRSVRRLAELLQLRPVVQGPPGRCTRRCASAAWASASGRGTCSSPRLAVRPDGAARRCTAVKAYTWGDAAILRDSGSAVDSRPFFRIHVRSAPLTPFLLRTWRSAPGGPDTRMSDPPPGPATGGQLAPCRGSSRQGRIAPTEDRHPEAPTMVRARRHAALIVICLGAGLLIWLGAGRLHQFQPGR